MKKAICFGLAALLLAGLLSGCDLQNRKPSTEFVPETQPTEYAEPPVIEAPETEPTEATVAVMQVVVHDLLFEQGEYYDRYGTTEPKDGWHMENPTGHQVIFVKP